MTGQTVIMEAVSPSRDKQGESRDNHAGSEIEIKFKTSPEGLVAVISSLLLGCDVNLPTQSLRSMYFDTKEGNFRKKGMILRIRKTGRDMPVLCFKSAAAEADGPFLRKEVEVPSPDLIPNFKLLADCAIFE